MLFSICSGMYYGNTDIKSCLGDATYIIQPVSGTIISLNNLVCNISISLKITVRNSPLVEKSCYYYSYYLFLFTIIIILY